MAVKYVSDFTFPSSFGFTGSAPRSAPRRMAQGGTAGSSSSGQPVEPGPSPAAEMNPFTRTPTAAPMYGDPLAGSPTTHMDTVLGSRSGLSGLRRSLNERSMNGAKPVATEGAVKLSPAAAAPLPPKGGVISSLAKGGRLKRSSGGGTLGMFAGRETGYSPPFGPMIDNKTGAPISPADLSARMAKMPHVDTPAPQPSASSSSSSDGGGGALSAPSGGSTSSQDTSSPAPSSASTTTSSGPGWGSNIAEALKELAKPVMAKGGRIKRSDGGPMGPVGLMPQQPPLPSMADPATASIAPPQQGMQQPAMPPQPMSKGGRLSASQRNAMPSSQFALPGKGSGSKGKGSGSYPIPDPSHARMALAMVSAHGSSSEKAAVRAKVHSKYPGIGRGK